MWRAVVMQTRPNLFVSAGSPLVKLLAFVDVIRTGNLRSAAGEPTGKWGRFHVKRPKSMKIFLKKKSQSDEEFQLFC